MGGKAKRFSIGKIMNAFVIATVFFAVASVCTLSFMINARQIDEYFKRLTINSAENFASFVDADFLARLRKAAESEEYQTLRDKAEELDDERLIEDYLREEGLLDQYMEHREMISKYLSHMGDIKYLYIVAWGDMDAEYDMYLLDDDTIPIYETGYYETREPEFAGVDPSGKIEPVISKGDWGWLCSGFAPVFDKDGNLVCHVGCDVGMEELMRERRINLTYTILSALICMALILVGAILFGNKLVVEPLNAMTKAMKKFSPSKDRNYQEAGVIDLDIRRGDEIGDIYQEIKSMQTRIMDYIHDIVVMERDKEKVEADNRNKDIEIGEISREAYKDALTGIGNKNAYVKKSTELNAELQKGMRDFAIVMLDVNCLKMINDNHGHSVGDDYLKGCSKIICNTFKHSAVYRIGGDEFVAILTGEDFQGRHEKVAELRHVFDSTYHDTERKPWERYSASVGMADCCMEDSAMETVFSRADQRMYEEKMKFKKENGIAQEVRV